MSCELCANIRRVDALARAVHADPRAMPLPLLAPADAEYLAYRLKRLGPGVPDPMPDLEHMECSDE